MAQRGNKQSAGRQNAQSREEASPSRFLTLSVSRDIPFNQLRLSDSNVRRIKAGVSIEQLAEDIARRTLLQSLTVRPILDADGNETGQYEIPAGGRRYRALELLVKQKRLSRTAPIPCLIRTGGIAEEDSLAENVQRAPLHPLDQFRAFLALREKGQTEEAIAAAFFIPVSVVRQRLRLAAVSPRLLEAYVEDAMTLEQLMAFTVSTDHERQEQVFERLKAHYSQEPPVIRRLLTEGAVRASDKRARFIGIDAYEAAGGTVLRDLFQGDDGGWLQDVTLVDRLVTECLAREADTVRAEGWRWIEVAPDFPYGHSFGLRQLRGDVVPLTPAEDAELEALREEYCALEEAHAHDEGVPDDVDRRLNEIEARVATFDERPLIYDPAEIHRAGAFISIDGDGRLKVQRGYVRPEDERPVERDTACAPEVGSGAASATAMASRTGAGARPARARGASTDDKDEEEDDPDDRADGAAPTDNETGDRRPDDRDTGDRDTDEPDGDDATRPLSDRLMAELTTHRTLALRHAIGEHHEVAFLAALHAFCLKLFYPYGQDTCLDLDIRQVTLTAQAPGLNATGLAKALEARHQAWAQALPREATDLWDMLADASGDTRQRLFAHCIGLSVNAVQEGWNRRPRALAHAGHLATAVRLDMNEACWTPTVDRYLGRVTKARILQAVREARGDAAADRIAALRKGDMAEQAQVLLAGTGWLPEPLRTPDQPTPSTVSEASATVATQAATTDVVAGVTKEAGDAEAQSPADTRPSPAGSAPEDAAVVDASWPSGPAPSEAASGTGDWPAAAR